MNVRVISDGTPRGTKVLGEDGERIRGVQRIVIELDNKQARGVVTLTAIHVESVVTSHLLESLEYGPDVVAGKHLPQEEQDEYRRCQESIVEARR